MAPRTPAAARLLKSSQLEFLHQVVAPALASEREYGVPACITLAQSILESAGRLKGAWMWGGSPLFRLYNNPFGIKATHHIAEPYQEHAVKTQEVVEGKLEDQEAEFEHYRTLEDAFRAHALLLSKLPGYAPAMAVAPDWRKFAVAIMECGYSTDRPELCKQPGCLHYAGKLINLVMTYRLNDLHALAYYAMGQDPGQEPQIDADERRSRTAGS
jgi:flagellum-specific peptidoglycan hydrolase FlgJ